MSAPNGLAANYYTIRPWEREHFARCRRAWDLSARERQNWEPKLPARVFDFSEAVHDALAVYYFPGMWDWNRVIVRPLATEGFLKSMRRQREFYTGATGAPLSPEQEADWENHIEAGRSMLEAYYDWAAEVDRFSSVQVETLFDVTVPDPASPTHGLLTSGGRGINYRLRVDMVAVDEHELYWLVDHRVVMGDWPDLDHLMLDEQILTRAWAWELGFLARVSGTIHNELRLPSPGEPDPAGRAPVSGELEVIDRGSRLVRQQSDGRFRRTQIPRGRAEIEGAGARVAAEAQAMTGRDVAIYPTPADGLCAACLYRPPCLALMQGDDPEPVLQASYQPRTRPDFEEGRLGSVWGFVPHRPDQTHVRLNPPQVDD
jgi:hypothetical protein